MRTYRGNSTCAGCRADQAKLGSSMKCNMHIQGKEHTRWLACRGQADAVISLSSKLDICWSIACCKAPAVPELSSPKQQRQPGRTRGQQQGRAAGVAEIYPIPIRLCPLSLYPHTLTCALCRGSRGALADSSEAVQLVSRNRPGDAPKQAHAPAASCAGTGRPSAAFGACHICASACLSARTPHQSHTQRALNKPARLHSAERVFQGRSSTT